MGRSFALLVCILLLSAAHETGGEVTDRGRVSLTVKPVLCITDKRNQSCEMSFIVFWKSDTAGHYCLYNDFSGQPLDCWNGELSGRARDERIVARTFSYWLTAQHVEGRVAEAIVEVMTTDSSDRRRNRRHRHVWSIL